MYLPHYEFATSKTHLFVELVCPGRVERLTIPNLNGTCTIGSGNGVHHHIESSLANPLQLIAHYDDGWKLLLISDERFTCCVLSSTDNLVTVCIREAELDQMPEEKVRRFVIPVGASLQIFLGDVIAA